ncbi:ester cyclase [Hansschlegelia plantiphila]|uniref:SnoaL-like domain-containing protein n=1 Tax=Hansschlegelia plantiphila TaxID=374655 RepID=A0A9W6IYP9_9HYPH|nr:ester cyclase [Hansschlegelia plantiphila]GLK67620.1 hypothetical protein GCM10008179_12580 [Hansschlegelia plantiphila]
MKSPNKKVAFSTFLDQVVNGGDYAALYRLFHPEFVGWFPDAAERVEGVAGIRAWVERLREAFPDINTLIEGNWMTSEDDAHHVGRGNVAERLSAYVVLRGTHTREYAGASASGRIIAWQQIHLVEFHDGLIVSDTAISDRLTFYSKTGAVMPPPGIPGVLPIREMI